MSNKKVLIVDDDQYLVMGLAVRLKASGYQVISAKDAASAIALNHEHKPDLIILDLGLPGADGFTVLESMKAPGGDWVPTIVLSARSKTVNRERALNGGALAFFQKPADNHAFMNAIRQALDEPAAVPRATGTAPAAI